MVAQLSGVYCWEVTDSTLGDASRSIKHAHWVLFFWLRSYQECTIGRSHMIEQLSMVYDWTLTVVEQLSRIYSCTVTNVRSYLEEFR